MNPGRARRAGLVGLVACMATGLALAQNPAETEKKLERVRGELKSIASERRQLEGQRGDASRQLRQVDEQVASTSRALGDIETALEREAQALVQAQQRRTALAADLQQRRTQLAELVRAAYRQGTDAPLKVLLSQDRIGDAGRAMAYYGYFQRDQAGRIRALAAQMHELDQLEQDVARRRAELDATRARQQAQVAELERDRRARAQVVAELEQRYQDRAAREKALGRDAKALETLLRSLRAAAARAEAERRAAARREAAAARQAGAGAAGRPGKAKAPPPKVANAPALKVGGLSWPASGTLLARFGGRMPDGRTSPGVLIGAPQGSAVTAVADGTVVFAEWMTGYGNILILDHGNGYMSLYAHNDALLREVGARVGRGEAVARVGTSGGQGVPALYFELRRDGQPVDPASWLQRR